MGVFKIKIVIIGDPRVGKTSLRRSYLGQSFQTNYLPTIAADFTTMKIELSNDIIQTSIFDLAGHSSYDNLLSKYYQGSQGAVIVADITNKDSFENLSKWTQKLIDNTKTTNKLPVLYLANKVDLRDFEDLTVGTKQFGEYIENLEQRFSDDIIINYGETSALTGFRVPHMFSKILQITVQQLVDEYKVENKQQILDELRIW